MGITHVVSSFRRAETVSIADCEVRQGCDSTSLRTYGPYRSDYGRLGEYPNLPPLLVRCCSDTALVPYRYAALLPLSIVGHASSGG